MTSGAISPAAAYACNATHSSGTCPTGTGSPPACRNRASSGTQKPMPHVGHWRILPAMAAVTSSRLRQHRQTK